MMKFKFFLMAVGALLAHGAAMGASLTGLYQTIDDKTNRPKSIVALYEYPAGDGAMLGGRIVALYGVDGQIAETIEHPVKVAEHVPGAPTFVGLDIIWDMRLDGNDNRYTGGKIMDPQSGKVYSSVIWQDVPGKLNVRGKIGPFGRTQNWNVVDGAAVPSQLQNLNTKNWTPSTGK